MKDYGLITHSHREAYLVFVINGIPADATDLGIRKYSKNSAYSQQG